MRSSHAQKQQSKRAARLAFDTLMISMTTERLMGLTERDVESIARSYSVPVDKVRTEILRQKLKRSVDA